MEQNVKLLPQGINDFGRIRREGYYYVDKTMFIDKIERDSSYMLLVRPRRFGKSLTVSMLDTFFNYEYPDSFQYFKNLKISKYDISKYLNLTFSRHAFYECSHYLVLFI